VFLALLALRYETNYSYQPRDNFTAGFATLRGAAATWSEAERAFGTVISRHSQS